MKRLFIILVLLLISLGIILPFFVPKDSTYFTNLQLVLSGFITLLLPFTLLSLMIAAWLTKHLHVKLERMNIAGVNLLFHKPDKIFINNAKAYLETKRTLYKIDGNLDNFNETLDSYFETYQFFKTEMKYLDITKDEQKELYELSTRIIKELNAFLTGYQNNFRRWYNFTLEENSLFVKCDNGIKEMEIKPHLMRIGELQRYYYDYDELINGFIKVNDFFINEVNPVISVNYDKWEVKYNGEA